MASKNKISTIPPKAETFRHDMRTHLSAIISLTDLIKKAPEGSPIGHLLDALHLAADNAIAMMDGGIYKPMPPSDNLINILDLLSDFDRLAKGLVQSSQANFTTLPDPVLEAAPQCKLDPIQLHRVLILLLDNALHYAKGADITLTASVETSGEDQQSRLMLCFCDNGPGFSEEDPEILFYPYQRGASHHETHGSGLGLWSARNIIAEMNGTIRADHNSPQGAKFLISLPLTSHNEPSAASPMEQTEDLVNGIDYKPLVLVIDDNKTNHLIMAEMLKAMDVQTIHALSGPRALELLEAHKPDLILIDIRMPKMDGWDTARKIRSMSILDAIPLAAISADERPNKIHYFSHWIQRPIRPADLYKLVKETKPTRQSSP